jgi:type I restriction enzyme M protein
MEKLTADQKKALSAQIKTLDPKGEIVSLAPGNDFKGGSISYNKESGIIFGEGGFRLTDEEYVRAWLVVRLVKVFRYPADSVELEHTYAAGRPSPTRAQVDIRIHDKRGKKPGVFMLIEAKRPDDYDSYVTLVDGQLFATGRDEVSRGLRYAVWHSVEFHGAEPRDKCIIIDFRKFTEHREWVEAGEPGHNLELPMEYGTVRKTKYVKGKTDLRNDLTKEELARLQKDFHNRLWGGAKMGDTDVFNNLIKMLIAKIYDEKVTVKGSAYLFQVELKDGVPESAEEIVTKVNGLYQDALRHYFKYDDETIQHARINKEKFKPEKVAYVFEKLEPISILDNQCDDDVLGVFFEGIVRTGFKQEKGQFFTHVNIVRFILHTLEIDSLAVDYINGVSPQLPYLVDSSCGSGSFLIESMKLITQAVLQPGHSHRVRESDLTDEFVDKRFRPEAKNKNAHNAWAEIYIYGIEDNEDLALATKVNMILHGDGNANIHKADGLANFAKYRRERLKASRQPANEAYSCPVNEQFDIVVGNPPFSLKEDPRTLAEYGGRFLFAERKNSENLFIERWYQLLKPGGRLGVVLPDSVFDTNENLYIRLFLYRFFFIKAVVSLPQVAFQPYTPTKTSLLFAVKKTKAEVAAWDAAWRDATNEYGKLRRSKIIGVILTNDRLRSTLIDMVNRAEVEWYPASNLLAATSLPATVRAALVDACEDRVGQKKKLAKLLEDFDAFTAADPLGDFSGTAEKDVRKTLARLLRNKAPSNSGKLPVRDLLEAAYDDLVAAAALNHTEDPRGENYCNAWWCFAEVTARKDFDYPIFLAEAEHVGYKRSTRHPEGIEQSNDLFATDSDGNIVIDTEYPKKILDHLRASRVFR